MPSMPSASRRTSTFGATSRDHREMVKVRFNTRSKGSADTWKRVMDSEERQEQDVQIDGGRHQEHGVEAIPDAAMTRKEVG